jgi:hypothetical protein
VAFGGIDADVAGVGAKAFAHTAEAHSGAAVANGGEFLGGDALTEIADFDEEAGAVESDMDVRGLAAGVAVNIGQTFLDDAEDGEFQVVGQAVEFGDGKINLNRGALLQTLDIPSQSGAEAEFIEQRGMKQIRRGAKFLIQFAGEGEGFLYGFAKFRAGVFDFSRDLTEIHGQGSDDLAGAIVHFAGEAATLFVLGGHEADGEFAKLIGLEQNIIVAGFEFAGASLDLLLERFGEFAETLLAPAQRGFSAFAFGDVAGGTGD